MDNQEDVTGGGVAAVKKAREAGIPAVNAGSGTSPEKVASQSAVEEEVNGKEKDKGSSSNGGGRDKSPGSSISNSSLANLCLLLVVFGGLQHFLSLIEQKYFAIGFSIVCFFLTLFIFIEKGSKNKLGTLIFPSLIVFMYILLTANDSFFARNFRLFILFGIIVSLMYLAFNLRGSKLENATKAEFNGLWAVVLLLVTSGAHVSFLNFLGWDFTHTFFNLYLLYTPWWVLTAAFVVPDAPGQISKKVLTIFNFLKIGFIIYFAISILFFPSIAIASDNYDFLPSIVETQEELQETRAELSKEISPLETLQIKTDCAISDFENQEQCVEDEILHRIISKTCEEDYGFAVGSTDHDECYEELMEAEVAEKGSTDTSLVEHLEIDLVAVTQGRGDEYNIKSEDFEKLKYVFELEIDVPDLEGKEFTLISSCEFRKGSDVVAGVVDAPSNYVSPVQIGAGKTSIDFTCSPTEIIEGRNTVAFQILLEGLETRTTISPIFTIDEEKNKDAISSLERQLSGDNEEPSSSDEFARVNFHIGDGIIEAGEETNVRVSLENFYRGGSSGAVGRLVGVNNYELYLGDVFVEDSDVSECFYGDEENILFSEDGLEERGSLFVDSCYLKMQENFVSVIEEYEVFPYTLEGYLDYDYELEVSMKTENIVVEKEETENEEDSVAEGEEGSSDEGVEESSVAGSEEGNEGATVE